MRKEAIQDLFDFLPKSKIKAGEGLEFGFYPFYTSSEIQSKYLNDYQNGPGCLVFGTGGKASVHFTKTKFATSTDCISIKPKNSQELYGEYVFQYLKGNMEILEAGFKGAGLKHISKKYLSEIKIPLPPLDDQKRIAHLLGKVEGMIAQRKQHLQQLDELLKSVFLEMFSPVNPDFNNWPVCEIKDLAANHKGSMRTGPFGSNLLHSEFVENGEVAVLGIDNAVQNKFSWDERRFITKEKYLELENYKIYPGDVIITIMGTVGRSAVIPENIPLAINTKHLAAITLNRDVVNPVFLSFSIHSSPYIINQFKSKNRGAIMSGLNLTIIKEIKLNMPPITLQNQFATIVEKVESLKTRYQSSLSNLENLYGALSQKAFKGELNLERVTLPVEKKMENAEEVPMLTFDEGLSEEMKKILEDLNNFNNNSATLSTLCEAAAINLNRSGIKAFQMLAEQAMLWKNPLDELKNMPSVFRAIKELAKPSALQQMTTEQLVAFRSTKNLAQQLAASFPKVDMSFIEQQKKLIESTTRSFEKMQKTLAYLNPGRKTLEGEMAYSETVAHLLQADIPDYASWEQKYISPESIDTENEGEEPKHIFTFYDITDALAGTTGLSFKELSKKLSELEKIDLLSYERIKCILFELLTEGTITQKFHAESQTLHLRLT